MVEIYGLYDPETNELRYIGKANSAIKRLKTHIQDARSGRRPVCLWIRALIARALVPRMEVLERVKAEDWKDAERRWIASHTNLLNVAPGGDQPSCTDEQRRKAARASNIKQAADPAMHRVNLAKRNMAKLHARFRKSRAWYWAYLMRLHMKMACAERPDIYACWANL